jgi:hypothetical protein
MARMRYLIGMRRTTALAVFIVALAVVAFAFLGRSVRTSRPTQGDSASDSVWYHASDAALLGQTGRPQLLEFFHPG